MPSFYIYSSSVFNSSWMSSNAFTNFYSFWSFQFLYRLFPYVFYSLFVFIYSGLKLNSSDCSILFVYIKSESFCYIITCKFFFYTGYYYSSLFTWFLPVSRLLIVSPSSGIVCSYKGLKFFPLFIISFKTLCFIKSKSLLFKYS